MADLDGGSEVDTGGAIAPPAKKSRKKLYFRIAAVFLVLYLSFGGFCFYAMHQPPQTFARIIDKISLAFLIYPFQTMWNIARAGELKPGDIAPDFELSSEDGRSTVRLSAFRDQKPVALVFGSYT